jgi:SHAQKYF class myb-like DNA-binding protein
MVGEPWSPFEHDRFVEALEKYGGGNFGNEWELISDYIGKRSVEEVKEHAQQYFQKLEHEGAGTKAEDAELNFSPQVKLESPLKASHFDTAMLTDSTTAHFNTEFDATASNGFGLQDAPPFTTEGSDSFLNTPAFGPTSTLTDRDPFSSSLTSEANKEGATWTAEENVVFENALSTYDERVAIPERWHKIATLLGSKSVSDVTKHYERLVEDLRRVDQWQVSLPPYANSWFTSNWPDSKRNQLRKSPSKGNEERRKGVPWTEDEHRLFLLGLQKHGKGDWRNISRNFVVSRTPTQVASHAQKFFIRLNSLHKDKRARSDVHG